MSNSKTPEPAPQESNPRRRSRRRRRRPADSSHSRPSPENHGEAHGPARRSKHSSHEHHGGPSLRNQKLPDAIQESLGTGTFIVFDLETTGGNPEKNGITEIFAIRYRHGEVEDTFYSMVNPGIPIPPIVRRMTGITNAMVREAPRIREVMPSFVEFIGDGVLVSHNTIGDMKFVRYFAHRVCQKNLENFYLCTHLLSEKIFPEAPSKSLSGLGEYLKISSGELHRAEGDAYLTLELFKHLQKKMLEKGFKRIIDGIRLQGDMESGMRLGWGVDLSQVEPIASTPGVFYLFDKERKILFLSSAAHLDKEIAKLSRYELLPRQLIRLVLSSYDLRIERYPNLFSAMLHECTSMESHRKLMDPSKWHNRVINSINLTSEGETCRLSLGQVEEGTQYAFGPIRDRKMGADLLSAIAKLCDGKEHKEEVTLPHEMQPLVLALLKKSLPDLLHQMQRSKFAFSMIWRHADRRRIKHHHQVARELQKLQLPDELSSLLNMSGIAVARDADSSSWQVFVVVRGVAKYHGSIRGPWEQKIHEAGFSRRLCEKIQLELAQEFQPITAKDARRANATLWWILTGSKRADGAFLPLEELLAQAKQP